MPTTLEHERNAQRAAVEHLTACFEAADSEADSPASAPFCGCYTCIVREVLTSAWPHLLELAREEAGLLAADDRPQLKVVEEQDGQDV